ncbi:MAG TPA: FG-GAP-like repeat-containing protein, partial [Flavisolibacter sp.]|nr:FG-GAP-like repeat-containing protein [Flavisolibacter sp.]
HFGMGTVSMVDSVVVTWPNKNVQILKNIKVSQKLKVKISDAYARPNNGPALLTAAALFKEVTQSLGISYKHRDFDYIDFNIQTTLPHKLSEYCPALAAGDLDGNGLDDLVAGGTSQNKAQVFLQQANGRFLQRDMVSDEAANGIETKDGGILLLDVDGDGSLDVYVTGSGYEYNTNSVNYKDRLYKNDGKGNFATVTDALPNNYTSKLCVRAADYNKDGKLDLFLSGRVDPWHYPRPVSSFIYRNDSQNGKAKFTDVTADVAPGLKDIGMVCDALFTDFDGDGEQDLLLAGEWMPLVFLKYANGKFTDVTTGTGIGNQSGWWNSVVAGDFRNTGRTDYIVGNVGSNTLYTASNDYPVYITAKDFDNNGGYEAVPSLFLPSTDGSLKEFPANGRDELIDRMPFLKKRFNNYVSFATATINDVLTNEMRKGALRLQANNLQSCFVRNDGGGKFSLHPLPQMAQVSTLSGMVADDFDGDGNLDVVMSGNDYGTEVSIGRYDALNGLLLEGNGKGDFTPLSILQSGIYIPGNGKGLVKMLSATGDYLMAASQNQDALKMFRLRKRIQSIRLAPGDEYAVARFRDGSMRKEEFYHGASFLSQSSRFMTVNANVQTVEITGAGGKKRRIDF